ncbi:MAG: hypothetical protein COB98_02695 [Flavobacteriaceae bacterium]|nr:MAG: hypothetical protein COB98_02695 [Flavobacteriaceae bacterium]
MRGVFKRLSYVMNPIVFPILGTILYFIFLPSFVPKDQVYLIFIVVFGGTYLLPILLLGMLKKTALIHTFFLKSVEERKFPLVMFLGIAVSIGNMLSKVGAVEGLTVFFFGYAVALVLSYLLLMLQIKISLHAVAIGGLTAFMICLSYYYALNLLVPIAVLIALGGLMMSARLYLKTHTIKEVFLGYIIGVFGQSLMYVIYNM